MRLTQRDMREHVTKTAYVVKTHDSPIYPRAVHIIQRSTVQQFIPHGIAEISSYHHYYNHYCCLFLLLMSRFIIWGTVPNHVPAVCV